MSREAESSEDEDNESSEAEEPAPPAEASAHQHPAEASNKGASKEAGKEEPQHVGAAASCGGIRHVNEEVGVEENDRTRPVKPLEEPLLDLLHGCIGSVDSDEEVNGDPRLYAEQDKAEAERAKEDCSSSSGEETEDARECLDNAHGTRKTAEDTPHLAANKEDGEANTQRAQQEAESSEDEEPKEEEKAEAGLLKAHSCKNEEQKTPAPAGPDKEAAHRQDLCGNAKMSPACDDSESSDTEQEAPPAEVSLGQTHTQAATSTAVGERAKDENASSAAGGSSKMWPPRSGSFRPARHVLSLESRMRRVARGASLQTWFAMRLMTGVLASAPSRLTALIAARVTAARIRLPSQRQRRLDSCKFGFNTQRPTSKGGRKPDSHKHPKLIPMLRRWQKLRCKRQSTIQEVFTPHSSVTLMNFKGFLLFSGHCFLPMLCLHE